ncbi:MAG TPA: hypothetical protein VFD30_21245 [Terriglobia bacterium]|nr:hypothetical protein [Terriglobia bacterium]
MARAHNLPFVSRRALTVLRLVVSSIVLSLLPGGRPARAEIRTVYIIPFAHWDRGFLTSPEEIRPLLKPHLDEVIDLASADPEYRWTVESVWQLNEWLERTRDSRRIGQLRELVKRGQIEISGAYGSMHTEFMDSEELNLLTQDGFRMARALGVSLPELAVTDDVPGYSERIPQVLALSHVRFLLTGANLFIGGGTSLAPGEVPFYWQGPDGSRVLTWVSQGKSGGYVEGMQEYYVAPTTPDPYGNLPDLLPRELQGKPPLEVMEIGMERLRNTYEKAGYKYDAVLVMYVHDFISPTVERDHLLPWVRKWNASGRQPQLRVATPKEFFTYILSRYASEIPTYRGDWSGLWSEVKTNSPGIDSLAREVQTRLRTSSLLWGALRLMSGEPFPSGNFLHDYRRLWNYDEHSGAGQTGWPGLMTLRAINDQNREYVEYVRDALRDQDGLLHSGLKAVLEQKAKEEESTSPRPQVVLGVFQPLSWPAVSLITFPRHEGLRNAVSLRDLRSKATFPVQWSETHGMVAAPLPATGLAVFEPVAGNSKEVMPAPAAGLRLENRFYSLELRGSDGAIAHLIDRESGKELVNVASTDGFNQLIRTVGYQRVPVPVSATTIRTVRGPVFDAIEVSRPWSVEPVTEYRLFHDVKRLEIRNLLDRARMPAVLRNDRFNVYQFSFPILPGAAIHSLKYENGNRLVTFPDDYLPGTRNDAVVSHGIVLSSGSLSLSISSPQAFFWNLPNLNQGSWALWQNELLSTVWRKQDLAETRDLGNYLLPTVEPGLPDRQWFVYSVTSWNGPDSDGGGFRRIWESVSTPQVELLDGRLQATYENGTGTLFGTDSPNVMIVAAEPSLTTEGAVVLRLQEIAGRASRAKITLPVGGLATTVVDFTEAPLAPTRQLTKERDIDVEVGPYATISILLKRPKD